jgi:hypothetical protein
VEGSQRVKIELDVFLYFDLFSFAAASVQMGRAHIDSSEDCCGTFGEQSS